MSPLTAARRVCSGLQPRPIFIQGRKSRGQVVGEAEVNFNQPARSNQMSEGVATDYDSSAMLGRRGGREAKERPQ
jgi:hypothetical protein